MNCMNFVCDVTNNKLYEFSQSEYESMKCTILQTRPISVDV